MVLKMLCWKWIVGEKRVSGGQLGIHVVVQMRECGCEQVVKRRWRVLDGTHIFAAGFEVGDERGRGEWMVCHLMT